MALAKNSYLGNQACVGERKHTNMGIRGWVLHLQLQVHTYCWGFHQIKE